MQSIYGKKTTGSEVIPGTSKDDWVYPLGGSDTVDCWSAWVVQRNELPILGKL